MRNKVIMIMASKKIEWLISFKKDGTAQTTTNKSEAKIFTRSGAKRIESQMTAHGFDCMILTKAWD